MWQIRQNRLCTSISPDGLQRSSPGLTSKLSVANSFFLQMLAELKLYLNTHPSIVKQDKVTQHEFAQRQTANICFQLALDDSYDLFEKSSNLFLKARFNSKPAIKHWICGPQNISG
jgi:hypothetical protein